MVSGSFEGAKDLRKPLVSSKPRTLMATDDFNIAWAPTIREIQNDFTAAGIGWAPPRQVPAVFRSVQTDMRTTDTNSSVDDLDAEGDVPMATQLEGAAKHAIMIIAEAVVKTGIEMNHEKKNGRLASSRRYSL